MISVKNVSMQYGPVRALDGVSFEVRPREILGLLGPNGAGKSTLMKILTTILYPVEGTAEVNGYDILTQSLQARSVIGYLPEQVPLYLDMRVDDYLTFVGRTRGLSGDGLSERLEWLKDTCSLRGHWKHGIHELSKGYRQRVGLAQALIHDPAVLILDEVTTGLDPLQLVGIRQLIKDLAREKTIIFSTHVLQEVETLADRMVIINEGRVVAQGTRAELSRAAVSVRHYRLAVEAPREAVRRALEQLAFVGAVVDAGAEEGCAAFDIQIAEMSVDVWRELDRLVKSGLWPVKAFYEQDLGMDEIFIALLKAQRSARPAADPACEGEAAL